MLKRLEKQIFPYEKELTQRTGRVGGRDARVDAIKNILFNNLSAIHAASERMSALEEKVAELTEMNSALTAALADADKNGRKTKAGAQQSGSAPQPVKTGEAKG